MGYELNLQQTAPEDMVDALRYGSADMAAAGAAGWLMTEANKSRVDFSAPYTVSVQTVVLYEAAAEEPQEEPAEDTEEDGYDFKDKKIGVQLGTTGDIYATDFEDDGTAKVERFNKAADAIQALRQQKVRLCDTDEQPALQFVMPRCGHASWRRRRRRRSCSCPR